MSGWLTRGSDSGGAGSQDNSAFIRAAGDPRRGVKVTRDGADSTWGLRTVQIEEAAHATARLHAGNPAAYLLFTYTDPDGHNEVGNDWSLVQIRGGPDRRIPATYSRANVPLLGSHGGVTITWWREGAQDSAPTFEIVYLAANPNAPTTTHSGGDWLTVRYGIGTTIGQFIDAVNATTFDNNGVSEAHYRASLYGGAQRDDIITYRPTTNIEYDLLGGRAARDVTRDPLTVTVDASARQVTVTAVPQSDDLDDVLDAFTPSGGITAVKVDNLEEEGESALGFNGLSGIGSRVTMPFTGGSSGGVASVSEEAADKLVFVRYSRSATTFGALMALDTPSAVTLTLTASAIEDDHPEAPGWTIPFGMPNIASEEAEQEADGVIDELRVTLDATTLNVRAGRTHGAALTSSQDLSSINDNSLSELEELMGADVSETVNLVLLNEDVGFMTAGGIIISRGTVNAEDADFLSVDVSRTSPVTNPNYEAAVEDWLALEEAEENDALVAGTTGLLVRNSILFGRTEDNEVLFQIQALGFLGTTANVTLSTLRYEDGALGRRVSGPAIGRQASRNPPDDLTNAEKLAFRRAFDLARSTNGEIADDTVDAVSLNIDTDNRLDLRLARTRGMTLEADVDLSQVSENGSLVELLGAGATTPHSSTQIDIALMLPSTTFPNGRAVEISFGIDVVATDELIVRLQVGSSATPTVYHDFHVPIFDWARLRDYDGTDEISVSAGTAYVATERGGTRTMLVGRTSTTQLRVQVPADFDLRDTDADGNAIDWYLTTHTVRFAGGLLDHRVAHVHRRHRICAMVRSSSRPAAPTNINYNGRTLDTISENGLTYYQAGGALPRGSNTIWLLFGEAVYNPTGVRWDVQGSWLIVDSTDTALSITYGVSWIGPWNQPAANANGDVLQPALYRFARLRRADDEFIVRRIGSDVSPDREPQLLATMQMLDRTLTTYSAPLNFDFDPSDFRLVFFELRWTSGERDFAAPYMAYAVTGVDLEDATSVVGNGNVFNLGFSRYPGSTHVNRSNIAPAGSSNRWAMRANFVRADNSGSGPFTTLSGFDLSVPTARQATLRVWVL